MVAIRHCITALRKSRWHIFQSVCPRWEHEASLSTLILWDSGPFGIIYSQSGPGALRGQRSALGHSYHHNPGAFLPSACTLRLGQTRAKVKAHIVGERDFPQFSGHWTLNNVVLVGLACAIFICGWSGRIGRRSCYALSLYRRSHANYFSPYIFFKWLKFLIKPNRCNLPRWKCDLRVS